MNKQPKVSVVVPIYGVEKYLHQCVDSILAQTLTDIEIILVDDGSKDNCPKIVDEYAKKDSRVVAVHQPNGGYGRAVNHGIELAKGEYIGIIEADDWIEPDMYEKMYNLAFQNNVDVVKSNFYFYWENKENLSIKKELFKKEHTNKIINPFNQIEFFSAMPCIWSAIYRQKFLLKNNIKLLETPGASFQDTSFNFKVWALTSKVWLTSEAYVHYRQDNESSSINNKEKVFCICDEFREIEKFITTAKLDELLPLMWKIKFNCYQWNLNRIASSFKKEFFKTFRAEFLYAHKKNLLDKNLFKTDWARCYKLIKHPKAFFQKIILFQLFGFIPIFKIKNHNQKLTCYILGIPVLKIVKKGY